MDQTNGQSINNYILQRKLGEGGMGDVYLARHSKVERTVAIKILHQNLFTNETIRTRFKNEANALIKLAHPNIIKIYDYVEQESVACLIVEYFDGITLDDYINKLTGPIPSTKAVRIFGQVLDAVQYAHDHNILHRDIKPGNIMVSRDGNQVRIMDFGIAKLQDAVNLNITHANIQLGTPFYMSPEQVKGLPYTVQSDIYSLGVTLYEMVTGKCPYSGITNLFELQSKIVSEPLPSTDTYYPNVPAKVQEAIKTATNKNSAQRFKACLEFRKFLEDEKKETIVTDAQPAAIKTQKKISSTNNARKESNAFVYLIVFVVLIAAGIAGYAFLKKPTIVKGSLQNQDSSTTSNSDRPKKDSSVVVPDSTAKVQVPPPDTTNTSLPTGSVNISSDPPKILKPPTLEEIINDVKAFEIKVPEERHYTHSKPEKIFTGILRYEDERKNYILTVKYEKGENRYNLIDHDLKISPKPVPPTQSDPCKNFPYPTNDKVIQDIKRRLFEKKAASINDFIEIVINSRTEPDDNCSISFSVQETISGHSYNRRAYYIVGQNGYKLSKYN